MWMVKIKRFLFTKQIRLILIAIGICLLIFGFFKLHGCAKQIDETNSGAVLGPNESTVVIVDPYKHSITLITPDKIKAFTLPARPSRVSLLKNDGIKIISPQFGPEFAPFLGVAFKFNDGVILGGLDIFYWKRLDIGLGVAMDTHLIQRSTMFVGFSYLAWSNCSVGVGVDTGVNPLIFIKVRL